MPWGGLPATPPGLRFAVAVAVGAVVGVAVTLTSADVLGPLAGWDTAAVIYLAWAWLIMAPLDADATALLAVREDPGRAATDVILLTASVASLAAVASAIAASGPHAAVDPTLGAGLGAATVVLSWAVVHTVFTARYARLYYTGPDGGIGFHSDDPPAYADFAYVAFTIGMTFQVSDTDLQDKAIRRTALRHALLSYLFGAIIIAVTINLLAGLAK